MASLDDINAWLDGTVVLATDTNTDLIQIAISRIVRGYLGRIYSPIVLVGWATPDTTPDIIREAASMLIASQLYLDKISGQEFTVYDQHYAQILYNRAIALLQGIVDGSIIVIDPITGLPIDQPTGESLSETDFWPVDDTDRAFTMGMVLY
jgi:hypothetical protein